MRVEGRGVAVPQDVSGVSGVEDPQAHAQCRVGADGR